MPDIWFLTESRRHLLRESHIEGPPDLMIEIVSPDSQSRDWREKYLEYQAAGVREYWMIDPMSRHVEAYTLEASPPSEASAAKEDQYRRLEEREGHHRLNGPSRLPAPHRVALAADAAQSHGGPPRDGGPRREGVTRAGASKIRVACPREGLL